MWEPLFQKEMKSKRKSQGRGPSVALPSSRSLGHCSDSWLPPLWVCSHEWSAHLSENAGLCNHQHQENCISPSSPGGPLCNLRKLKATQVTVGPWQWPGSAPCGRRVCSGEHGKGRKPTSRAPRSQWGCLPVRSPPSSCQTQALDWVDIQHLVLHVPLRLWVLPLQLPNSFSSPRPLGQDCDGPFVTVTRGPSSVWQVEAAYLMSECWLNKWRPWLRLPYPCTMSSLGLGHPTSGPAPTFGPLTSRTALDKWLRVSMLRFPHLENGTKRSMSLTRG